MTITLLIIWALDVIGVAYLLGKHVATKYGVKPSEIMQERRDERALKQLWKEEMG